MEDLQTLFAGEWRPPGNLSGAALDSTLEGSQTESIIPLEAWDTGGVGAGTQGDKPLEPWNPSERPRYSSVPPWFTGPPCKRKLGRCYASMLWEPPRKRFRTNERHYGMILSENEMLLLVYSVNLLKNLRGSRPPMNHDRGGGVCGGRGANQKYLSPQILIFQVRH